MIDQQQAFTPCRSACDAVIHPQVPNSAAPVPAAVGAAVPQAMELPELPGQASPAPASAMPLKYAMVDDDVVVVDPVGMSVIDAVRSNAH